MTEQEQQLRELFAFDASRAPLADGLADRARRRVRLRRRQMASIGGSVVLVVVLAAGAPALTRWTAPSPPAFSSPDPVLSIAASPSSGPTDPTGPFGGDEAVLCVEMYTLVNLAHRAFAFDGTVVEIGSARTNRPGVELPLAGVTFRVNQWFRGGSAQTVTVDMGTSPQIGTRLLVSGQPRWGGTALTDAIAWGCGFTRYYDPDTAAQWAR